MEFSFPIIAWLLALVPIKLLNCSLLQKKGEKYTPPKASFEE